MTDPVDGQRTELRSLSRELALNVPSLREIELTSNSVKLIVESALQKKIVIIASISIESEREAHRAWASVTVEPLIAPGDFGGMHFGVGPPGLRLPHFFVWRWGLAAGAFGAPFQFRDDQSLATVQPRIVTATARRLSQLTADWGDLTKFAAHFKPDEYDDPLWITTAETQAYCLFAAGRAQEASEALRRAVVAEPWDKLDPADRATWVTTHERATRSLAEMATPGLLERRLDGWAQERLSSYGIDRPSQEPSVTAD